MKNICWVLFISLTIFSCNQPDPKSPAATTDTTVAKPDTQKVVAETKKPAENITYSFVKGKDWIKSHKNTDSAYRHAILAINRIDMRYISYKDSVLVPSDSTAALAAYLPFPTEVPYLKDISKIIFFSYPAQAFGAYENGKLIYTGPTNMGRKADPTPTGLFYTNWKAKETISTVNDEWKLKWNFNIANNAGVGFHQYALPGYPASHSCLRLLEEDARYLYYWADQWKLKGGNEIISYGTPVVVFGSYKFGAQRPWYQLAQDPHALDISADELQKLVEPNLIDIMQKQQQRQTNATDSAKK